MIVSDPRPAARAEWVDLTVPEAVEQLRLGVLSEFFNDFEADPHVIADCPNHGLVPVHEEGICEWGCGYDFMTAATVLPVEDNTAALTDHNEQEQR